MKNKSSLKHTQNSYGIRPEAQEFPMMCVLSFVYICNAKCPNCPYNNSEIRSQYKDALIMPELMFKRIADECGQYGSILRLSGGGEPMLHPKVVELIEYAKKVGDKIVLITNGSRFTEENSSKLLDLAIDIASERKLDSV